MSNEHNPIALLISKIQDKWNKEVSPNKEIRVSRWVLKPDQGRIFEGFLKLESSAHGSIPEMVLVLLQPFKSSVQHSKDLLTQWIDSFEKDKIASNAIDATRWNIANYKEQLGRAKVDHDLLLLDMMADFQSAMPDPTQRLVLALLPNTVSNAQDYLRWLEKIVQTGIQEKCMLMVFDYESEQYFDSFARKNSKISKSLSVELNVQGAMAQIAKSGDPNSPELQYRACMIHMSEAVNANNLDRLHHWGKRGMEIAQKTGDKGFFASSHLIYAGMLFQFKKFDEIEMLLDQGLVLAQNGLRAGNNTCLSLEIQFWGYKAACCQHKKKYEEAGDLFVKQAEISHANQLTLMALTAWWQAYNLYQSSNDRKYIEVLEKAYEKGSCMSPAELRSSTMSYIAFDYYQYCHNLRQFEACKNIDAFMATVDGEDWKESAEKYKMDTKRKRFLLF